MASMSAFPAAGAHLNKLWNSLSILSEYSGADDGDFDAAPKQPAKETDIDLVSDASTKFDSDLDDDTFDRQKSSDSEFVSTLHSEISDDESFMLALTTDIFDAVNTADFRNELQSLLRDGAGPDASGHLGAVAGREELCLAALHEVPSNYGYEAHSQDLEVMMCLMENTSVDREPVAAKMFEIYDCLGLAPRGVLTQVPWAV